MRHLVVMAGLVLAQAAFAPPATALDCIQLASGKGTLVGLATQGAPEADKNILQLKITRGEHVVVTLTNLAKAEVSTIELDGIAVLATHIGAPPKTLTYFIAEITGDNRSLEPGTRSSYTQTTRIDGREFLVERVTQEIGQRKIIAISGCDVETLRVHRDFRTDASENRRSIDIDFSPSIGFPLFSSAFHLWNGNTNVMVFEITSIDLE